LVLNERLKGPRRFSELQTTVPQISRKIAIAGAFEASKGRPDSAESHFDAAPAGYLFADP
jgi:hypothetical protein